MIGSDIFSMLCICIPLIMAAPAEDSYKQQIAAGLYRNDDPSIYWGMVNQDSMGSPIKRGGLDSLGRGNILRDLGGEWGHSKLPSWRFFGGNTPKRGGLDSLGRGNILRSYSCCDELEQHLRNLSPSYGREKQVYITNRQLDSLGNGNILKRGVRTAEDHDNTQPKA